MESKRINKLMLKYIELANLKGNILEDAKKMTQEELNFKPSEKEWSFSQVISHIIESETGTNKYVNKKIKDQNNLPKSGIRNYIASKALDYNMKSNRKFKTPKVLSEPINETSFIELKTKWDKSRSFLIETVENFPTDKLNKSIFKHPVAGNLNILQTLSFMTNHLKHHVHQLESIKLKLSKKSK